MSTRKLTPEQQELVTANMALAFDYARKNSPPGGMDFQEWESECLYRLCIAASTYKPELGWAFSTYAVKCLSTGWCTVQHHMTREMRDYRRHSRMGDLDILVVDQRRADTSEDVKAQLDSLLARLPERERLVLQGRAGGKILTEIGEELGITRERVRQIQERALTRLWRHVRIQGLEYAGE